MLNPISQDDAARQIQSYYRNYRMNKAATLIQSFYKGRLVRRVGEALNKSNPEEM